MVQTGEDASHSHSGQWQGWDLKLSPCIQWLASCGARIWATLLPGSPPTWAGGAVPQGTHPPIPSKPLEGDTAANLLLLQMRKLTSRAGKSLAPGQG